MTRRVLALAVYILHRRWSIRASPGTTASVSLSLRPIINHLLDQAINPSCCCCSSHGKTCWKTKRGVVLPVNTKAPTVDENPARKELKGKDPTSKQYTNCGQERTVRGGIDGERWRTREERVRQAGRQAGRQSDAWKQQAGIVTTTSKVWFP